MARFTMLYSGSSGNAGVIEEDGRFLMVDLGGSCRATVNALHGMGLRTDGLEGILVSHEHSDHVKGLAVFLKRHPVPVYGSVATLEQLLNGGLVPPATELVAVDGRCEEVGGFVVAGFATCHDSAGCCGFRVRTPGGAEMAIATDLGHMSADVFEMLDGAALVALEANYDWNMLMRGPYPWMLKKRIDAPTGHLSNQDSAATVAQLIGGGCRRIMLVHLSEENNRPDKVLKALEDALFESGQRMPADCVVQIARRYDPSEWMVF